MAQGNVLGQSGIGSKINGIIEEYSIANGENIKTGDFVKFINEYRLENEIAQITLDNYDFKFIPINESKALILYVSRTTTDKNLYACIFNLDTNSAIVTQPTIINSTFSDKNNFTDRLMCKKHNDKFFIFYIYSNKSMVVVLNINEDNTINFTRQTDISLHTSPVGPVDFCDLDENHMIISYSYKDSSNNYYIYSIVIQIDDENILYGSNTLIVNKVYNKTDYSIVGVVSNSDNICKCVMMTAYGSSWKHYYTVFSVDLSTLEISILNNKECYTLNSYETIRQRKIQLRDSFIFFSTILTNYYYITIVSLDKMDDIIFNHIFFKYNINSSDRACMLEINNKRIIVSQERVNEEYYLTAWEIKGFNINKLNSISSNSSSYRIFCFNNKVFVGGQNNYEYLIKELKLDTKVTVLDDMSSYCNGVAKTSGNDGDTVKVYIPK